MSRQSRDICDRLSVHKVSRLGRPPPRIKIGRDRNCLLGRQFIRDLAREQMKRTGFNTRCLDDQQRKLVGIAGLAAMQLVEMQVQRSRGLGVVFDLRLATASAPFERKSVRTGPG